MLVSVQILSKVIESQDFSLIEDNTLTDEYFPGYENEFNFIVEHYAKYGNVPDKLTFLSHFSDAQGNPTIELVEVSESDEYLIEKARELRLYTKLVPSIQKAASLLKDDSNAAVEYLMSQLTTEELQPSYEFHDEEIVSSVHDRVQLSRDVQNHADEWFIPTGFDEIDADTNGLQRGDEFGVIFARTNMGKSWVLEAIATHSVEIGLTVGYFSPEMATTSIGYRFDTLHGHMPNKEISFGRFDDNFSIDTYAEYANSLSDISGRMYVTKPKDFARKVTVSKLRNWIKSRKLDMLCIDGITYLTDERYNRGDSKTVSLTNISEDLMGLSEEMRIPILVVVQSNRGGISEKDSTDTPELENIRDSDGIAFNASKVFSVKQMRDSNENTVLIIALKKVRIGEVGKEYTYQWDINKGEFIYKEHITTKHSDTPKKAVTVSKHTAKKAESEEDEF